MQIIDSGFLNWIMSMAGYVFLYKVKFFGEVMQD